MPTLIQHHRKSVVETKLSKFYSAMNQAVNMAVLEYGDITEWGRMEDCGLSTNVTCNSEQAMEVFNKYFGKHIKYTEMKPDNDNSRFLVYFADGSILAVTNFLRDAGFYLDKKALENKKTGINSFSFRFSPVTLSGQTDEKFKYHLGKGFEPYAWNWDGTRESLIHNSTKYGCGDENHAYCTKLIQYNGWKIPDDYPLKF